MKHIANISAKGIFYALLGGLMACTSAACSDNDDRLNGEPDTPEIQGDSFVLKGSVLLPEMPMALSRGAAADKPGAGLKLTLLEFNLDEDTDYSYPTNNYQATVTSATDVADGTEVKFEVTLKLTSDPRTLQLLIANDYFDVGDNYQSMSSLLPQFSVEGTMAGNNSTLNRPSEAYWGQVDFPHGYSEMINGKPVLLDEVKTLMTKVPVIRNFAKISVSSTVPVGTFEILGWELINVPTSGTVVPWDVDTHGVPTLFTKSTESTDSYEMLDYDEISYKGVMPPGAILSNTEVQAKNWPSTGALWMSPNPRFMYEHPYDKTLRTYLIVQGRYTAGGTNTTGYYKVDIGKLNTDGTFDYYNILRNIHYNVVIKSVLAPGTSTIAEAIARAPFNNLLSSTETSAMLNMSDGVNMLMVNDTNHIIVDANSPIEILYRYVRMTGNKEEANDKPTVDWGGTTPPSAAGPVIKSVSSPETFTDPKTGWNWVKYVITPNTPDDKLKTQDITIMDGHGLGRTIHLILRKPWEYVKVGNAGYATVQPGKDNLPSADAKNAPQPVSNQAQKTLTVYFNLPDGLPDTMFPLEFRLESEHQWIENNKLGTLLVSSGPSLWNPDKSAISYIKTVSYNEYRFQYTDDDSNNVNVNKPNSTHTVRCRFTTIAGSDNNAKAAIRIYNEYFYTKTDDGGTSPYADVHFTRSSSVTQ